MEMMLTGFILGMIWGCVMAAIVVFCKPPAPESERDALAASLGPDTWLEAA